jgi:precorrin-4 methylase
METEDPTLFNKWIEQWEDLVDFEVIPVVSSEEATKAILHIA